MTLAVRTSMDTGEAASMLRRAAAEVSGQVAISDVRADERGSRRRRRGTRGDHVIAGHDGRPRADAGLHRRLRRALVSRVAPDARARHPPRTWRAAARCVLARDFEGAGLCLAGIALGVAGAMAIARWLSSKLSGISPTDPATYIAVAGMVSLVTLVACYVPTRRAMGVDPLIVLRNQ